MAPPKILFMGTPEFAQNVLEKLLEAGQNIVAVVTQPDKPQGRGQKVFSPPVAACAKKNGLHVLQPEKLSDSAFQKKIKELEPDFIVVAAYGKFIPEKILSCAKIDCLNVHPSLLPEYRGAAPIHRAILDGKKETGVSIMRVTNEMDAGPVFLQKKIPITESDTSLTLSAKLANLGGELMNETIEKILNQKIKPQNQDTKKITYAAKLSRELSKIDWSQNSERIFNQIRGLLPWPAAQTTLNGQTLKIYASSRLHEKSGHKPGQIVHIGKQGLTVATGDFDLLVTELQLEGKKRMNAFDLSHGLRLEPLQVFFK